MTSDVLEQFRQLRPLLEKHAREDPQADVLAAPVVKAVFEDSDLMRLWIPHSLGGLEIKPTEMLSVMEELSDADSSTGFTALGVLFSTAVASSHCSDAAAESLWGSGKLPILAGSGAPGKADATEGGYRVTGRWTFASGIKHASHTIAIADVYDDGEPQLDDAGVRASIVTIVPVEQVTLIENWDVMGLRRTGSVDFTMEGVFVPEGFTHPVPTEPSSPRGGPVFSIGLFGFGCVLHSGWVVGVAKRALDELAAYVSQRPERGASEELQKQTARMQAKFLAARALLHDTWADIEWTLEGGEPLSDHQNTMSRTAMNHVTVVGAEVCSFVYQNTGANALKPGPVRDCFQDVHVGMQHFLVGRFLRKAGQKFLGLAADEEWELWAPTRRPPPRQAVAR